MSILDDAIREHLELKRQHGAPDDEVKKLEDEAFGPPARPDGESDSFAEAATEFMTLPETGEAPAVEGAEVSESEGRRVPDIADLQEAPPAPEPIEEKAPIDDEAPAEEEHPAMEHEAIAEPAEVEEEPAGSHTTEERHAIAEQPTQMFDVESELAGDARLPAAADEPAPSDEEIVDSELSEPRLAPIDPLDETEEHEAPLPADEGPAPEFDDADDFFDEQRLSDELDQALEAPAPAVEEAEEDEEIAEEPTTPEPPSHKDEHEDVLEDTPDFLEESPEDDQLWFEQKPPKDFDFDD